MKEYLVVSVLSVFAFLLIACTTQEVSDRPMAEDFLAAESGAVAGLAIQTKPQITYVKCADTDGNDPYTRGTVTGSYRVNGKLRNYRDTDSCWNNNQYVIEFTCVDDQKPEKVPTRCPAGCKNGACVLVECTDSDGSDLSTRGTTTGLNSDRTAIITSQDYCTEILTGPQTESGPFVAEGQCLPDGRNNAYHTACPSGTTCQNGACVGVAPRPLCGDVTCSTNQICQNGTCVEHICTDSDGGLNLFELGITTGLNREGIPVTVRDHCINEALGEESDTGTIIVEGICREDDTVEDRYLTRCQDGQACQRGVCPTSCMNVTCQPGQTCRDGVCVSG